MTVAHHEMPAALAARPHDPRRGIPIPFVNETDDGGVDFAAIQATRVLQCARERLCGSCGQPLGWWVAFLGGPESASQRAYLDPGMHPDCAVSALSLCPHIARRQHRRAPEHRLATDVITPDTMTETKPQRWVLGICRDYDATIVAARTPQAHVLFLPRPFKRTRTWSYTPEGRLTEQTPAPRR
ncbi:hypothetical protein A5739_24320 [Mycobacterium colombiense]|jgi:hypothetical protein|uniref:Uncharacterized protein n=1 Tax=Mycolicibacterium obuense TaxID=1807 RepID=A0A0M2K0P3_9MYCO|nr:MULTISPECIES: hypothetical protein [Mycobacteriaceae]KKF02907.1 hypothetical protein WN67_05955 [Mycolicibacterium obuense]OMC24181.1 hypothetical protein A5739_24320 [Mycobacterium colombiense]